MFIYFSYSLKILGKNTNRANMNNSSVGSLPERPNLGVVSLSRLLPIALIIVLTNGLVFFLFLRKESLRTTSNYLLLGLAISDFITGAINIPYFIVFTFNVVPLTMVGNFNFWMFALHTLMAVSAGFHILAITADKYFAVKKPLRRQLIRKRMMFGILVAIWVTSAVIAVVPIVWIKSQSQLLYFIIHAAVCLIIVFLVPYTFIIYAFIVIFKVISNRKIPKKQINIAFSRFQAKKNNERKCVIIFAIMATMFAFCWLPYFALMLIANIKSYLMSSLPATVLKAVEVFVVVRYTTSVTNPLLYTFFKRDFWVAFKILFGKRQFNLPSRSRSCSLSLRCNSKDMTQATLFGSNPILLVSWNQLNGILPEIDALHGASERNISAL